MTTWANHALTLQGGWNGTTNNLGTISGVSTFANSITISNWNNDAALNDISINGVSGTGLNISTKGNIKAHHVSVDGTNGTGAAFWNVSGSGNVTVDGDSTFSNSSLDGLDVYHWQHLALQCLDI